MIQKTYVTWEDVDAFVDKVCERYSSYNLSGVYGLPRGGLVFAVMISHRLNIPMLGAPAENCLIVDDICDSGESLVHYVRNSSGSEHCKHVIATMYFKENELGVRPDYFFDVKKDNWIVFPWE